ncbi:hypothetical protein KKB99_02520 [bacterium]|nr:hypothetical protein [bacterium]MBU1024861.1 hypothetical protein [bacterium]
MEKPVTDYLFFSLLWILWCIVHSATTSLSLTNFLKNKISDKFRFYRLFYNLLAIATLIPLVIYSISVEEPKILIWDGGFQFVRYVLAVLIFALFFFSLIAYDWLQFWGIRQIIQKSASRALSSQKKIISTGILGFIRHPLYLMLLIAIWILDLDMTQIIRNVILTIYILIGTILEERKLIVEYGDEYRDYQSKVSMLFPYKWIKSRIQKL